MSLAKKLTTMMVVALLPACNVLESKTSESSSQQRPQQVPQVIAANESAAIMRMRRIIVVEQSYQVETAQYASLDDLVQKGYTSDPSEGKLSNYRIDVRVTSSGFEITAVPLKYGVSGLRSFYADETNIIRGADHEGHPATGSDPEA